MKKPNSSPLRSLAPSSGVRVTEETLPIPTGNTATGPLDLQTRAPTREAADRLLDQLSAALGGGGSLLDLASGARVQMDANDTLYQLDGSRTYNPEPDLERIQARLIAINAPDDFINPPELGTMDRIIKRVKNGRYVLLPLDGRGHSSVSDPSLWKKYLEELLQAPAH
jgi:homoserine O-acetyltransferase